MHKQDLIALNETILINIHNSILRDIDRACLYFNVDRSCAEIIGNMPLIRLRELAKEIDVMIQPVEISRETWIKLANSDISIANVVHTLSTNRRFEK